MNHLIFAHGLRQTLVHDGIGKLPSSFSLRGGLARNQRFFASASFGFPDADLYDSSKKSSSSSSSSSSRQPSFASSSSKGSTAQRIRASSNSSSSSSSPSSTDDDLSDSSSSSSPSSSSSSRASRRISDRLKKSIFQAKTASDLDDEQTARDMESKNKGSSSWLNAFKEGYQSSSSPADLFKRPQATLSLDQLLYQNNSFSFLAEKLRTRWNLYRLFAAMVYIGIFFSVFEIRFSEPSLEDLLSEIDAEGAAPGVISPGGEEDEEERKRRKKLKEIEGKKKRAGKQGKTGGEDGEKEGSLLERWKKWLEQDGKITIVADTSGSGYLITIFFALFLLRSQVLKREKLVKSIKLIQTPGVSNAIEDKLEFTYGLIQPRTQVLPAAFGGSLTRISSEPYFIYEPPDSSPPFSSSSSSSSSSFSSSPPPQVTFDTPIISLSPNQRIQLTPLGLLLLNPSVRDLDPKIVGTGTYNTFNFLNSRFSSSSSSSSPSPSSPSTSTSSSSSYFHQSEGPSNPSVLSLAIAYAQNHPPSSSSSSSSASSSSASPSSSSSTRFSSRAFSSLSSSSFSRSLPVNSRLHSFLMDKKK